MITLFLQVRVVCSSNGTFIRQPGGHFEYEGGDTRLVSVSNWFSLASLKEAVERVVVRPTSSRSMSGPPEVCILDTQDFQELRKSLNSHASLLLLQRKVKVLDSKGH